MDCTARLEGVEAALPTIVLEAADAGGIAMSDVRVTIDDAQTIDLPSRATTELVEDPGEGDVPRPVEIRWRRSSNYAASFESSTESGLSVAS
jgi:hypothetical protein